MMTKAGQTTTKTAYPCWQTRTKATRMATTANLARKTTLTAAAAVYPQTTLQPPNYQLLILSLAWARFPFWIPRKVRVTSTGRFKTPTRNHSAGKRIVDPLLPEYDLLFAIFHFGQGLHPRNRSIRMRLVESWLVYAAI